MERSAVGTLGVAICVGVVAWLRPTAAAPAATTASGLERKGSVRSITLPEEEPPLLEAAGRETAQTYCVMCHTGRYIALQPPLPRATWLAEVTKMRTAYSAPIPEDKVAELVNYLVAVRGAEPK